MKILSIDTSGQQATAAIIDDNITISEILLNARTGENSWTHSEILMPGIDSMINLTGITKSSIDYIAYTSGPGSFTGLRIGASTALGLARGLNKPVIPVPTLSALAYNIPQGIVMPMMDARRSQVYFAIYNNGKLLTEYLAATIKEAVQVLESTTNTQGEIFVLGDCADANKEEILINIPNAVFVKQNLNRVRGSSVGLWAYENLDKAQNPSDNIDIMYIRAPQAIRDKEAALTHD